MLIALIVITTYLIGMLFYVAWMDDKIHNPPYIPETEAEKLVRSIKLRIADAQWKFRKELGEL
jgi:hypothetical protein